MKRFSFGLLARKKITFIFLIAIILPSLFTAYLSLRTFAQRRETLQQLLESNLWISGNAALNSFETALLELEKEALASEHFENLPNQPSASVAGKYFLLDLDYNIIHPKVGKHRESYSSTKKHSSQHEFGETFQQAEYSEFAKNNHARAAELYQNCIQKVSSDQIKALALEGLGRCQISMNNYDRAFDIYTQLLENYGHLQNNAGHPYGIVSTLQLYEISKNQKGNSTRLDSLLRLYDQIKTGEWLIDISAHDFFIREIETIVEEELRARNIPEIQKSFQSLKERKSSFLHDLLLVDFLETKIIPRMQENTNLNSLDDGNQPQRLLTQYRNQPHIASYTSMPRLETGRYGGFFWDLESLKERIIPQILNSVEKESGLEVRIIDEQDILPDSDVMHKSSYSLTLSYRQFPLPWKFMVSQPGLENLQRAAKREVLVYGILLSVIVTLMVLGALLIARDITREREATRQKTEFVHNVSHELKTPLTLIRLYGETLQRKAGLSAVQKAECYEIITKESERLSHLINNVLDFSRIDMGRKEFDFRKENMADAVRDTLESYRYHLEKKGFAITESIESRLPEIRFDREAISSVVINLLSNAMKFSTNRKEVAVRLFKRDKSVVLQVKDKGIGIAPKEIKKIFKRFYRSQNKDLSEARGSGLGLTLVKHITEAHGGRIEVNSEPGKGSSFSIIFPIDRKRG